MNEAKNRTIRKAEDEPQCKLVCPAECIVQEPNFVESQAELLAIYQRLHA